MHFLTSTGIALLALATTVSCTPDTDLTTRAAVVLSDLPFTFQYLFTAQLNLGPAGKPITIPGGVRVVEPIINGTVSGPSINATLQYSLATPMVINNGSTQVPTINAVGVTDDGQPIYLYEQGIGSPSSQVSRIQLEIGGTKYAALQNGFILASIQASMDRKTVTVMGYLVGNANLSSTT